MGSSNKCGLMVLLENGSPIDAAIICACDQSFVTSDVIARLASRFYQTGKKVVASGYEQTFGVPALFSKQIFSDLQGLDDAAGAKTMIAAHDADTVPFSAGAYDIDTPADVEGLACA